MRPSLRQAELRFLGYAVAGLTIAKYMRRLSPRPSTPWRTFLAAHIGDIVAVDFFVVPTLTFHLLFGFLILAPKYLLRDRDAIYLDVFARRVKGLGMSETLIVPRAPWQNPFAERLIGRFDGNVSITSSCSTNGISDVCCAGTSRTTTPPARISPSSTTAPIRAKCKRQRAGASL